MTKRRLAAVAVRIAAVAAIVAFEVLWWQYGYGLFWRHGGSGTHGAARDSAQQLRPCHVSVAASPVVPSTQLAVHGDGNDGATYLVDLSGRPASTLLADGAFEAWAPDGNHFVYFDAREFDLHVAAVGGSNDQLVARRYETGGRPVAQGNLARTLGRPRRPAVVAPAVRRGRQLVP